MYQLPILNYLFQDVEPYIDIHTMGLHYYKHHQNYLNQLNSLLKKNKYNFNIPLEEFFYHLNEFSNSKDLENILFNLGGVLNHNLYWKSFDPNKKTKPTGKLKEEIERKYGSYEQFWKSLKESALNLKGSGYTFFILSKTGQLEIVNLSNQQTPWLYNDIPLFTIDMWEHAYYLNYENDKVKYLDNFEIIADFSNANQIYNNIVK